jgi:hypothetical protein
MVANFTDPDTVVDVSKSRKIKVPYFDHSEAGHRSGELD